MLQKYFFLCIVFLLHSVSYGQYNSFSISVNSDEIGICDFEFYKYSTRSPDLQIFTWDGTTLTPYAIPNQVRTYRGRITNHSNYKAFAVWYPDDKIYIKVLKGKGEKNGGFEIKDISVEDYAITELNLPIVDTPQKSNWVLTSGYSCLYSDLMEPKKANGDYETLIAMWENGVNSMDYFATRDLGLSLTTNLLIIPIDSSIARVKDIINPNDYPDQINPVLTFWKTTGGGGGAGRHQFCDKPFKGGRTSFNRSEFGAMPHEMGHTLELGHYHNQKDSQNGNQFYYGRNSVAIATGHLYLPGNACLANPTPDYSDPLHPWVEDDYVIVNKNDFIDIDVLLNDKDYNNDKISIKSFDTTSLNGGKITLQGNKLRYNPPYDFVGRDYFNYIAESGQGNGYFTNYAKVFVDVRDDSCDRALRYTFDETSGNIVHDSAWTIESQNAIVLNGDFSSLSTPGIVGNAIDLSGEVGIILNDVLDPLDRDLSVSVWFRLNEIPSSLALIYDSGASGNLTKEGLSISVDSIGIGFHAQPEAYDHTGAKLRDTTGLIANKWYHAVMVIDRTTNTLRAYVNGNEITYSPTNNIDFDPEVIIKGYPGYIDTLKPNKTRTATTLGIRCNNKFSNIQYPLNGAIDEFRIFTKALDFSEISALYNSPGDLAVDCNKLSIKSNLMENSKAVIYPNPSTGIINILNDKKINSISIYSTTGKKVYSQNVFAKSTNEISIDLSGLSGGIYIVKLELEGYSFGVYKKIVLLQ